MQGKAISRHGGEFDLASTSFIPSCSLAGRSFFVDGLASASLALPAALLMPLFFSLWRLRCSSLRVFLLLLFLVDFLFFFHYVRNKKNKQTKRHAFPPIVNL